MRGAGTGWRWAGLLLGVVALLPLREPLNAGQGIYVPSRVRDIADLPRSLAMRGSVLPLEPVASWTACNNGGLQAAGNLGATYRTAHIACADCFDLRLAYGNYDGGFEVAGPNDMTIRAAVEYPAGTFYPVMFDSGRDKIVKPGQVVVSDVVGVDIPKGAKFYTRVLVTVADTTQQWPTSQQAVFGAGDGRSFGTTDLTTSGTVTSAGGSFVYAPLAILGKTKSPTATVIILGDSLAAGVGDSFDADANRGFAVRALCGNVGYMQGAVSGQKAVDYATRIQVARRLSFAGSCRYAVVNLGINDVASGRTLAQIQGDLTAIWNALTARGVKVWQCTLTPKTSSTDGWTTTAGQTVTANEAVRTQLNDWIRTKPAPLSGVFETADTVESARNSGIWKVGATAATGTATGGSTTTLTDTGASFGVNALVGKCVKITSGPGTGQTATVFSNTATDITFSAALGTAVGSGSQYSVIDRYSADGTHPSAIGHAAMANIVLVSMFAP